MKKEQEDRVLGRDPKILSGFAPVLPRSHKNFAAVA
jgi:hypothetical protein